MIQEDAVVSEALADARIRNGWSCACDSYGRFLLKLSTRFCDVVIYAIVNCDCLTRSLIQWKRMSIAFDRFCLMLSVAMPIADVLSHMIIVGFWGVAHVR